MNREMDCRAFSANSGRQCPKRRFWPSRYCWHHQDPNAGLVFAVVGVAITVVVSLLIYRAQSRKPELQGICELLDEGRPDAIKCRVSNTGHAPAADVHFSFNKMLPTDTRVFGRPEYGLSIVESERPPDPHLHPSLAGLQRAFAVRIPRVPPKTTIEFEVRTMDADNIRAAEQVLAIRREMAEILRAFEQRLSEASRDDAKTWILEDQLSALSKSQNFFVPGDLSSERGYQDIQFLTEDERVAQAVNSDLYSRYKQSFIEIYQNRPTFKAPVVRTKTAHGASTAAICPPYVKTYVEFTAKREDMHKKGGLLLLPPIPDDYETPGRPDASTEE